MLVGITSLVHKVATTHQRALVRAARIACLSHSMASWAKEVLGRVFSTKGSKATSETTSSSSRSKRKKTSWTRTRVSTVDSHRRGQSPPVNNPPQIVPTHAPVDQDEERDKDESPAVTAHSVQRATRQALEQTTDAPFVQHDPTIEWEPPAWDDLWRNSTKSMRSHSSSRLSTFLRTPKGAANPSEVRFQADRRNRSVSRKSSFEDLRNHGQPKPDGFRSIRAPSVPEAAPARHMSIKRSSLQKKLPSLPLHEASDLPPRYLQENAARNARILQSLQDEGVLDLRDSEDIDTAAVVWAPTVTHETHIVQPVQVVQRAVSREVHNHHFVHGVLPVVDVQVLPARHFCPDGHGGYVEISEDQIPGGKPDHCDQVMETEQRWMHYPSVTSSSSSWTGVQKDARREASRMKQADCTAEMTGEHASQHTFTYRTHSGLPSWTAIATESSSATPEKVSRH